MWFLEIVKESLSKRRVTNFFKLLRSLLPILVGSAILTFTFPVFSWNVFAGFLYLLFSVWFCVIMFQTMNELVDQYYDEKYPRTRPQSRKYRKLQAKGKGR